MMFKSPVVAALVSLLLVSCGGTPDVSEVSLRNIKADPDESIVSFKLDVSAATIQGVTHVPIGWAISIDNDASWHSQIKGACSVSAASLAPDEFKRLVFIVRRNASTGINFNMSGSLEVSKAFDKRRVLLNLQDFQMAAAN